ncbi:membrane protein [Leptolyngbya sp. BL0902]|uniref:DUF924 family protein n=1 Tax=Leptolyngbya sp. BL0902 TaxID=1115757 RepID=UPI0018E8B12C|nr:DUF924 family protein [Leptolyngbya sp. BL0902]QQE66233.1 membrane protein [Leptolyngbya sp. BL0902]
MDDVLTFWFKDLQPQQWWAADPAFDAQLRERFWDLLQRAAAGELWPWRATAAGRLAEIIVLDQFSRNIYRQTPQAFAQDGMALVLAQEAVAAGALADLADPMERAFLLMPYMHSESKPIHAQAEPLFQEHTPADNLDFERRHRAIIDRFGRYPHRNAILGRASTEEELEFLKQPGSRF